MKKILLSILLFVMFIPFIVKAETCNPDKVSISSITIEESSDNVTEIDEATVSGKNINVKLSMSEVGDSITYKVIFKNDSNEDYELDKNSFNISSDYIDYVLESEDNSNIIKANSSKVVYLKVNYANEVPEDKFESGTFSDNKTMTLNLATEDTENILDIMNNPKTGGQLYLVIIMVILLICSTIYIIFRKKKLVKFMVLIIGLSIMIPISVHALCKAEIKIDSSITINKNKSICFEYNDKDDNNQVKTKYFNYIPGERLVDTINNYQDDFSNIMSSLSCPKGDSIVGGVMHITYKNSENIESFENISLFRFQNEMIFQGTGELYSTDEACYKISAVCSRLL